HGGDENIIFCFPIFVNAGGSCGHVHKVHSFVTCRKSTQAIRPWQQHLLLNKLLIIFEDLNGRGIEKKR
ncbi:hypothetical protein, partial [uncultured Duncaniella sp.]|uniref:hypothetical protein n=1 Tax=uncultured Duncaniella sp. TaxID=2768039 RepID=UPI00267709B3